MLSLLLVAVMPVTATTDAVPQSLRPWVEYARQLHGSETPCPDNQSCVQLERMAVHGSVKSGSVMLKVTGSNLANSSGPTSHPPQSTPLFGPAATFAVENARWVIGGGTVFLEGDTWSIRARPGPFSAELMVNFPPDANVTMRLPSPFGSVVDELATGKLAFDESSLRHGGVMYLRDGVDSVDAAESFSVRAVRSFRYSSVVSFTYHFTIAGLREQASVTLPGLGGETIESIEPRFSYSQTDDGFQVALSPETRVVTLSGYFPDAPSHLIKPVALPFEHWTFESDSRHPVELKTDGVEVDPSEIRGIAASGHSRAFFLTDEQGLQVAAVQVRVDPGRRGTAEASINFTQGHEQQWLGSMLLKAAALPTSDRLRVPLHTNAHYASLNGRAVRLFTDDGALSLRTTRADGDVLAGSAEIAVQWREKLQTNTFFSVLKLNVPGQSLHLDETSMRINMRAGHVPVAVFGAENASGHLIDALHIYGLLIAMFGVALARAAKFPPWAWAVVFALLASLYTVDDFPKTSFLALLVGVSILARVPDEMLARFSTHKIAHTFVAAAWVVVVVSALALSTGYIQTRLSSAVHPWAYKANTQAHALPGLLSSPLELGLEMDDMEQDELLEEAPVKSRALSKDMKKMGTYRDLSLALQNATAGGSTMGNNAAPPVAKSVRPVPLDTGSLPSQSVQCSFSSIAPGTSIEATVLTAGPLLRGAWMFLECAGLILLLLLSLRPARRLWPTPRKLTPPPLHQPSTAHAGEVQP